ncbi:hypothetical protein JL720_15526 [Aureococcus anophagefferens]|nr:hypothetical protein JL720_15526 [Aureococcus anophagefferens]
MSGFNPFGKKPTAKEQAKQVKRGVRSSQRDLDRELRDLDRREQQIIADLKKEAKLGRSEKAVKLLAKNLVQLRAQRERVLGAKVQVGVGAAGKAMGAMNKTMAKANVGLSIAQFQRETERMNMTEEMMGDMLSDAFDTDEIEEETDAVVDGVLAEIGLDMTKGMSDAPTAALPQQAAAEPQQADDDKALAALQAQLNAL